MSRASSRRILGLAALTAGLGLGAAGCKDDPLPAFARISIEPREGPDDQPTRVKLRGDFVFSRIEVDLSDPTQSRIERSMTASLGRFALSNLRAVEAGVVSAIVHGEAMPPGEYDLEITDAENRRRALSRAFRIVSATCTPEGGIGSNDCMGETPDAAMMSDAGVVDGAPDAARFDAHPAELDAPDAMPMDQCPATCGDGTAGPDKECDDGNLLDGDGCSHCCRIEPGFSCMRAPSVCFRADRTTWVSASSRCPGTGTRGDPFCRLLSGVRAVNENVVILSGRYRESVEVRAQRLLIADNGAELNGMAPDALRIRGGFRVRVVGLRISGDADAVVVTDPRTHAILEECAVGPSLGTGVTVSNGAFVTIDRALIRGNATGGFVFNGRYYRLTDSVIAQNGFDLSHYGGVALLPASTSTGSAFVNNTVAGNRAFDTPGSVYCASNTRLVNSIIWANLPGQPGINSACQPRYSDLRVMVSGAGNFSADPMFTDDLYRLALNSPCVNAGDPAGVMPQGPAPRRDFSGKPRPRGPRVDVGAHEAR